MKCFDRTQTRIEKAFAMLLIAIAEIVSKSDSVEEVYEAISEMANAEGVILKPLSEKKKRSE